MATQHSNEVGSLRVGMSLKANKTSAKLNDVEYII